MSLELVVYAVVALIGGFLSLFFATAREALIQFSLPRLQERLPDETARNRLTGILDKSEDFAFSASIYLITCNVLFVIGLFGSGGLIGPYFATGGGPAVTTSSSLGVLLAFAALALIVLLLVNEAAPRGLTQFRPEGVLLAILPTMRLLHLGTAPVVGLVNLLVHVVARARGVNPEKEAADEIFDDILEATGEGEREGVIDDASANMIDRIIEEFKDSSVCDVMTPRSDVVALDVQTPVSEAIQRAVECGHSRIPIFRDNLDNVVGVLYVKDLLKHWDGPHDGITLGRVARKATFVPESQRIRNLLPTFQAGKSHFAIVFDEFGGTAGVVTIEDVLEEIVGDITDEFDVQRAESVTLIEPNLAEADGRAEIADVNEVLSIEIPESDDYDTIGGFVYSMLGRIPPVGEHFQFRNVELSIIDANERQINRIRIRIHVHVPPGKIGATGEGDGGAGRESGAGEPEQKAGQAGERTP